MYISEIKIKNIRCFEDFQINFEENCSTSLWTMITGDNSVGKSCLLRCIALGLCDEASAAALMKELKGQFKRREAVSDNGTQEGSIEISLKTERNTDPYKIITDIKKKSPSAPEKVSQRTEPEDGFPWKEIFVCGYGPHRALFADSSQEEYSSLEATYTLFNIEGHLQNPELVLNRQEITFRDWLADKLLTILMLDGDNKRIEFTRKGMLVPGPWGTLPFEVLSDGYRSTINWVTDFFGWLIYTEKIQMDQEEYEGILLIDELEQHLHPRWQRHIVQRLREQFPKIQFITTTHSPLVASGITDINDAIMISHKLDENGTITKEVIPTTPLKGMRADQILTSEVFGLPTARSGDTGDKMVRFRDLYLKESLTKSEQNEFKILKKAVKQDIPESGEMEEDRKVQREHKQLLSDVKIELELKNKKND